MSGLLPPRKKENTPSNKIPVHRLNPVDKIIFNIQKKHFCNHFQDHSTFSLHFRRNHSLIDWPMASWTRTSLFNVCPCYGGDFVVQRIGIFRWEGILSGEIAFRVRCRTRCELSGNSRSVNQTLHCSTWVPWTRAGLCELSRVNHVVYWHL